MEFGNLNEQNILNLSKNVSFVIKMNDKICIV